MNETIEATEEVKSLVKKAADTTDSNDALKFSQAALNVAHAMATLRNFDNKNN
jgi:hypothetical protein